MIHFLPFESNSNRVVQWVNVSSELYIPSLLGYKLSILLTSYRLFSVNKAFRICWTVVLIFTVGYLVSNMITQSGGCDPARKYYVPSKAGSCVSYKAADTAYGAMNLVSDLLIIALPVKMIWGLQLEPAKRRGLMIVFCSGAL